MPFFAFLADFEWYSVRFSAVPRPIGLKMKYVTAVPYSEMPAVTDCPISLPVFYGTAYNPRANAYLAFLSRSDVLHGRLTTNRPENVDLGYFEGGESRSDIDLEGTRRVLAAFAFEWPGR